jgi:hypothetical protein
MKDAEGEMIRWKEKNEIEGRIMRDREGKKNVT